MHAYACSHSGQRTLDSSLHSTLRLFSPRAALAAACTPRFFLKRPCSCSCSCSCSFLLDSGDERLPLEDEINNTTQHNTSQRKTALTFTPTSSAAAAPGHHHGHRLPLLHSRHPYPQSCSCYQPRRSDSTVPCGGRDYSVAQTPARAPPAARSCCRCRGRGASCDLVCFVRAHVSQPSSHVKRTGVADFWE